MTALNTNIWDPARVPDHIVDAPGVMREQTMTVGELVIPALARRLSPSAFRSPGVQV